MGPKVGKQAAMTDAHASVWPQMMFRFEVSSDVRKALIIKKTEEKRTSSRNRSKGQDVEEFMDVIETN